MSTAAALRERPRRPPILVAPGVFDALNVQRTVSLLEREGANAIQLEDQSAPRRCGHLDGKSLIGTGEMVGKIKAAVDARRSEGTLVVARTDAIAVEGFDAATERAERCLEAGADVLFVEAPPTRERLAEIGAGLGRRVPVLANMVEGGKTPPASAAELEAMGFRIVIFPGGLVRTIAKAATAYFAALRRDGSTEAVRAQMFDFAGLNGVLGTAAMLEHGAAYDGERFADGR